MWADKGKKMKRWLSIRFYNSYGDLMLCFTDKDGRLTFYQWSEVSMQFIKEIESGIAKGYNSNRILKRLEKNYGKGVVVKEQGR